MPCLTELCIAAVAPTSCRRDGTCMCRHTSGVMSVEDQTLLLILTLSRSPFAFMSLLRFSLSFCQAVWLQ